MSTRSSTRNLFPPLEDPERTIRRRTRVDPNLLNNFKEINMAANGNGDDGPPPARAGLPVPDLRTMEELCQPSLNGRGGPIAPIAIQATNFGLKNDMIQQVQNSCPFRGPGDDANKHLDKFLHVTQSMNSITTFDQMAKIFLGKYFPPSMVTKLRNDIPNFRQEPDESLFEAWERYKLSIDRCTNHNMLPVTQIDTFYNGLTLRHRDTINAAAGALKLEMAEINKNLMKMLQTIQQVNSVTPSCETCGGPHSYNNCPATIGQTQNVYAAGAYNQGGNSYQPQGNRNLLSYRSDNYLGPPGFNVNQNQNQSNQNLNYQNRNQGNNHQGNNQGRKQLFQGASRVQNPPSAYQAPAYQAPPYQAPVHQAPIPQPQVEKTNGFKTYMDANDAILKNMQTNITTLTNSNLELKNMFEDLKGITTRSGVAYQGPMIPTTSYSPPKVVECKTEVTKDTVPPTNNGSTEDIQPSVVQVENHVPISEPVVDLVSASMPNPKPSIPYPSRRNDERRPKKANDQIEKFYKIFKDLSFKISLMDALILMPKFASTLKALIGNK
ncbi:reverse transcriptase domain-containing protein [Tanacetum coccineum]